ncbi:MAG: CvpA family protein [Firmicutes bacterium]|nr:CvpA family protein [Bacillota bacterium]
MTGADFFILFILLFFLWVGYQRGIIKEFFEFLILTVNVLICSWFYGPLSDLIAKYLHLPVMTSSVLCCFILFLILAFAVWVLSGKAEAAANIPPSHSGSRLGGAVFGFAKGALIAWYLLLILSLIPYSPNGLKFFSDSEGVKIVQNLNPVMNEFFHAAGSPRAYRFLHPLIKNSNFLMRQKQFKKKKK